MLNRWSLNDESMKRVNLMKRADFNIVWIYLSRMNICEGKVIDEINRMECKMW